MPGLAVGTVDVENLGADDLHGDHAIELAIEDPAHLPEAAAAGDAPSPLPVSDGPLWTLILLALAGLVDPTVYVASEPLPSKPLGT